MLIRLGFSSGRQGPGDEVPSMRGLTVEFAVRPDKTGQSRGTTMRRTPAPDSSLTLPRPKHRLADLLTADAAASGQERPAQLEDLCSQFLAHASGHGFSPDEIGRVVRRIAESGE
jgi:DNA-binding transcriptional regulator YhcF (GntR family)